MSLAEADTHPEGSQGDREVLVEVRDLTFTYPDAPEPTLKNLSLSIHAGELIILAGPSGCGKSTLCRHLNGVIPHLSAGQIVSGAVSVSGMDVTETPVHILSLQVGMVQQDPESQIFCLNVMDELGFGPENLGLSHDEIVARVKKVVDWVGLQDVLDALTFECSGGQKQKIAIGSSLALYPKLLVMDEPTTDLDPVSAEQVVSTLQRLRDTLGLTFLVVEHDLDELLEVADRLVVMQAGQVVLDGHPAELFSEHYEDLERIGLRIPQHLQVARCLVTETDDGASFPIQWRDVAERFGEWIEGVAGVVQLPPRKRLSTCEEANMHRAKAIELKNVTFGYGGVSNAVEQVSLSIDPGEFVAIVGANGSGKSTLARLMIGLLHPDSGSVSIVGLTPSEMRVEELSQQVGYLFQNPDSQLFNFSVESEVAFGMKTRNVPQEEIERRVQKVLQMLGLEKYAQRHPFSLSRGERQRLALATVLVAGPEVIILDEPTTGQDRKTLDNLIRLMEEWIQRKRATVVMISHDMNLVSEHADRVVVLSEGRVVCDAPTGTLFHEHYDTLRQMRLLPPPIVRLAHRSFPAKLSRIPMSMGDWNWLFDSCGPEGATASHGGAVSAVGGKEVKGKTEACG
jgi:energy-coupling factor transport system ATP-binding protein